MIPLWTAVVSLAPRPAGAAAPPLSSSFPFRSTPPALAAKAGRKQRRPARQRPGGGEATRGSRKQWRPREKPASFAGQLQRARSTDAALVLLSDAASSSSEQPPRAADAVAALQHLALLVPRNAEAEADGARLRADRRLQGSIAALAAADASLTDALRCAAVWSLAVIFPARHAAPVRTAATALAAPLDSARLVLAPHVAATTEWACETLGVPVPAAVAALALEAPFRVHVGAVAEALGRYGHGDDTAATVAAMAAALPLRRDAISSGSAVPSQEVVLEDRGTCWLSDAGLSFEYSGKSMAAAGELSGGVAAVRDAVSRSLGRHYCSVLANHYPDGGSGMRFHSDPGQGEGEWGLSTAVVSVGAPRLFTFRRVGEPHARATFVVRHGDVCHMHSDCQASWQHSVVRERPGGGVGLEAALGGSRASSRISLVFKRSWRLEQRLAESEPPLQYMDALRRLNDAAEGGRRWPASAAARARVELGCGTRDGGTFTLAHPTLGRPARANAAFPALAPSLFRLERAVGPAGRPPSALCAVSLDTDLVPHELPPTEGGVPALVVSLGGARGGGEVVLAGGPPRSTLYSPTLLRGDEDDARGGGPAVWTLPLAAGSSGTFRLTFFTPAPRPDPASLASLSSPPLSYRPRSSDELVLAELLGRRPAYSGPPPGDPRWSWGAFGAAPFSPKGHTVLDVGAHIGVFTRAALAAGAARVVAVEPEPSNAALWRQNCAGAGAAGRASLVEAAVVRHAAEAGSATLLLGVARSDGMDNTWRHALRGLSHYKAEEGARAVEVRSVPFFELLDETITFVKMDCEGAELALLSSFDPGAWRGVRRLVCEWSFTKQRSMHAFREAVARLRGEGFEVWYEGLGNWDEAFDEWPWSTDAVLYAAR